MSELPEAVAGLIGEWLGDGVAASYDEAPDFRFGQQLTVTVAGLNVLSLVSRSWPLAPDAPQGSEMLSAPPAIATAGADNSGDREATEVMTESGFLRWEPDSQTAELVIATAAGTVGVLYGQIRPDAAGGGAHIEFLSDLIGRTSTAAPVAGDKRLYSRRGSILLYAVDAASEGGELRPRASAALHLRS